jgi:hypothetical protein
LTFIIDGGTEDTRNIEACVHVTDDGYPSSSRKEPEGRGKPVEFLHLSYVVIVKT